MPRARSTGAAPSPSCSSCSACRDRVRRAVGGLAREPIDPARGRAEPSCDEAGRVDDARGYRHGRRGDAAAQPSEVAVTRPTTRPPPWRRPPSSRAPSIARASRSARPTTSTSASPSPRADCGAASTITARNRSGAGIDRLELNTVMARLGGLDLGPVTVDGTSAQARRSTTRRSSCRSVACSRTARRRPSSSRSRPASARRSAARAGCSRAPTASSTCIAGSRGSAASAGSTAPTTATRS